MKNVLFLTNLVDGGELKASLLFLEKIKLESNCRMVLIGFDEGSRNELKVFNKILKLNHKKAKSPFSFIKKLTRDYKSCFKAVVSVYENCKIDLVLSTDPLMLNAAIAAIKDKNVRKVYYFHGIKHLPFQKFWNLNYRQFLIKMIEKSAFLRSSAILVPSDCSVKYIKRFLCSLNHQKFTIWPNLIDPIFNAKYSAHSLRDLKHSLGFKINDRIILYSGRIAEFKGLEELVKGFSLLLKKHRNVKLILAYPEPGVNLNTLKRIKILVNKFGIGNRVAFVKNLDRPDLSKLYQISEVTILASKFEFAPLSVIESIAAGTLVVANNVGNVAEVLLQIDSNLIMDQGTPTEIAGKIDYCFNLPLRNKRALKNKMRKFTSDYRKQTKRIASI